MIYIYNGNLNGNYRGGLFSAITSIIIGTLITLLSIFAFDAIISVLFFMIGLGIVLSNIFPLIIASQNLNVSKIYIFDFLSSLIGIILGVLFMFNHSLAISISFGVYLVLIPLIRIFLSANRLQQLKMEIPSFVIAILLFCNVLDEILRIGLIVIGSIILILGIVNLILELIYRSKHKNDNVGPFGGPFDDIFDNDTISSKDDSIIIDAEVKDLD